MSVCCKVGIEGRSSSQTSRAGLSSRIAMTWGMIRSSNRSQPVIEEVVPIKSSAAAAASHAEEEVAPIKSSAVAAASHEVVPI